MNDLIDSHMDAVVETHKTFQAAFQKVQQEAEEAEELFEQATDTFTSISPFTNPSGWVAAEKNVFVRSLELMDAMYELEKIRSVLVVMETRENTIRSLLSNQ